MIKIKKLKKTFIMGDEEIKAIDNIDFYVKKGEYVSIIGPSGSGKSTLMNILGLLDTADSGTYILDDVDVSKLSDSDQARIRNEK